MAEQNLEITYIPYGLDEISQLDLMTNLANGVEGYLGSKRWARKDKYRNAWLAAYLDIMNHGLTGASNDNGIWTINHNGEAIPLDSKSNVEREMYQDAAYYIQLQMAKMTPRKKEEEKKKEDLTPFKFKESFSQLLLNNRFGGDSSLFRDSEQGWNALDARDEKTGLRGTAKRREAMASELEAYLKTIEDGKFNFEGTSFKDENDARTKIQTAINALRNTPEDESDDIPAFNALGLNYRGFFSNGGNEASTHLDSNGNPYTYNLWNQLQLQLAETKAKLETEKLKLLKANQYSNYKYFDLSKFNGRPLTSEESNVKHLNEIISKDKWSGDEASQIVQAFKLAERNGQLVPITDKNELAKFGPIWKNRVRQLRKINGIDGIYYDIIGKKFVKPYKNGQTSLTSFLDILDLNNPEALKEKQNQQSKISMNTPLSLMTEWSPEMKKEVEAIGWDIASIIDPEAFSGSAMALYASHLRDEANPNRGTLEKWFDRGTAALGGILGVGDLLVTGKLGYRLYQLGKSMGSVSKFAGMLGAGFGAIGAFEARDSIAKLTNPSSLTPLDIENISYGFMGLIGLKSFAKARNKQTIGKQANPTTTEYNITIKDKNNKTHEIKIDEAAAKEILLVRTFGKKKETVDSEILNMPKIKESIQKYKEANPTKKLEVEGASIVNDSKSAFGISGKNKLVTLNKVKNPNAPEYAPVGTKRYNPFGYMAQGNNKWGYYLGGGWQRKAWENAVPEHSSKGLWLRTKEFWNPEPKPIKTLESTVETPKTGTTSNPSKTSSINTKSYNKNQNYEYNILNTPNKSSSKILLKGDSLAATLADGNNYRFVYSNEGEAIVMLNGRPVVNPVKVKNLKEAKEIFSNFVKDINSKLQKNNQGQFVRRFESKYLDQIRELKRKGFFMKQGGQINPSLDKIIEDFINNNNI